MSARWKTRRTRAAALSMGFAVALLAAACGDEDFENEPRPPVPLQLTGVVTDERLTVSPAKFGAGPIAITLSNQTGESHTITLEGQGIQERVGPINPEGTATIQKTLRPGQYLVRAASEGGDETAIRPATLVVGKPRDSASDELLLP